MNVRRWAGKFTARPRFDVGPYAAEVMHYFRGHNRKPIGQHRQQSTGAYF